MQLLVILFEGPDLEVNSRKLGWQLEGLFVSEKGVSYSVYREGTLA